VGGNISLLAGWRTLPTVVVSGKLQGEIPWGHLYGTSLAVTRYQKVLVDVIEWGRV